MTAIGASVLMQGQTADRRSTLAVIGILAATGAVLWTAVYTAFRLISAGGPDADGRTR
ncbi:hypothetical protein [Corynebacterium variabile]|uniref:hypothetical protein n=1 Tax=Corynebacterium variabile TaxID=1727 RepID=UPI0028ACEE3C|nr:hypothetical protein [Corynebacterium variabile]